MEVQSPILQMQEIPSGSLLETGIPKNSDKKARDIIFDTLNVQFNFRTLFYQLAAHLCMPLFPFLANLNGQVGFGIMNFLGAYVNPVAVYVMIVTYAVLRDHNEAWIQGAFAIPLIYFLQHRFVISIKYASLSPSEYCRFMSCKDLCLASSYLQQMQLFTGWYQLNPNVVRFELAAASARMGARINEIDLRIASPESSASAANQLRAWNAFLRGHEVIDFLSPPCKQLRRMKDGSYALSVYHLCEALVMHAGKHRGANDERSGWVTSFFNAVNLSIPLMLMAMNYKPNHSAAHWACIMLFYGCSTMLNWSYAKLFYVLLYGAVVDVHRRRSMHSTLSSMIRVTDITLDVEVSGPTSDCLTEEEQRRVEEHIDDIMSIADEPAPRPGLESGREKGQGQGPGHSEEAPMMLSGPVTIVSDDKEPGAGGSTNTHEPRGSVLGERIYRDNETPLLPRISFDESHNIIAWTHARLVLQNFGERFHFRLELYVIASITMLVVMMAVGLLNLGMAEDRMVTFFTPWFLQTLLSVTMCIAFNVMIMHTGSAVNEALEAHSQIMCAHSLRLHRKIESLNRAAHSETTPTTAPIGKATKERLLAEAENLGEVAEKLEAMRGVVQINTQQRPYKVFGFTAQSSLTVSILTTALSFYSILFSLLFNSEHQALSAVS